ncbi:addiction module protein [Fulvivirga sp.]|uniref:addiction module protein n=1 Tax=Fulvivirga sp. TaxID=1931237 RepID=UPI0032ECC47F
MDIQTIKVDLIHWLTELQDRSVLEQLQLLKFQQETQLSDAHKALLDERIASYKNDPNDVLDWEEVMKDIEDNL